MRVFSGRTLTSITGRRAVYMTRRTRQNTFEKTISVSVKHISENLPEILIELLSDLYAQFDFFVLTRARVNDVIREMKGFSGVS